MTYQQKRVVPFETTMDRAGKHMSTHRCMRTPDKSKGTINQFRQAPHRRNLSDPRPRLESQTQDPDPNWEQHNRIQGHDCSAGCLRSCQKLVPVHVVNQKTIDNFLISHAGVGASSRYTVGCQGGLQMLERLEAWSLGGQCVHENKDFPMPAR